MIASLRGKIAFKGLNRIIVDVNGVGYEVAVSLSTLEALPQDAEAFLNIHTALRENALELYGFGTQEEKALFEMLLTVAGIGPRISLNILSSISPEGFRRAVLEGDLHRLTSIPGIGKKSAERIVLELKEKIHKMPMFGDAASGKLAGCSLRDDLVSSLTNLGYKERMAETVAKKVLEDAGPDMSLPYAVKTALKELMK
jgi:holliday junction DNA helicase RuvA